MSLIIGSLFNYIGFVGLMAANIARGFGALVVNSARSAHLKNIFSQEKSEIAGIDTIFSPLGVAVGSLIALLWSPLWK